MTAAADSAAEAAGRARDFIAAWDRARVLEPALGDNIAGGPGDDDPDLWTADVRTVLDRLDALEAAQAARRASVDARRAAYLARTYCPVCHFPLGSHGHATQCLSTHATGEAAVPLRRRSIPDQLDYHAQRLGLQLDPNAGLPKDTWLAIAAAILGMGVAGTGVRELLAELEAKVGCMASRDAACAAACSRPA